MSKFVENYEIKPKILGSGMYGNVHLAEHTSSKTKVAIKVVKEEMF
jgi:serine/threonine protein kinase